MADSLIDEYRQKLVQELGYLAAREGDLSEADFQAALNKATTVFPGTTDGLRRYCSEEFKVSPATVRRWLNGRSLPPALVRAVILVRLRKHLAAL